MRNGKQIALAAMIVAVMGITTNAMAAVPSLTSVSPNLFSSTGVAGNETVEIFGSGFFKTGVVDVTGAAGVTFGGTNAFSYQVLDDGHISAQPPAHAKGTVNIVVTNSTGASTSVLSFSYTTPNKVLQVTVNMTIGKNAQIMWDAGTFDDDTVAAKSTGFPLAEHPAGDIKPFLWWVRDSDFDPTKAEINLASQYTTNNVLLASAPNVDNDNAHTLNVKTVSSTLSNVEIDGIAADTVPTPNTDPVFWKNGNPANPDEFKMEANITGTPVTLASASSLGTLVTMVTATPHGYKAGEIITVAATGDTNYNGTQLVIVATPTLTSFTYNIATADNLAITGGTVKATNGTQQLLTSQGGAVKLFFGAAATALNLNLRVSSPASTLEQSGTSQSCTVSLIASAQ